MKIIISCLAKEVWRHWKKVESFSSPDFRWDIRGKLPKNIRWYLAKIEEKDLEKIYLISSDDWKIFTKTFRLLDVVRSLNYVDDEKVRDIEEKKRIYQNNIDALDKKFIVVSPSIEGNFTIIEGNKRAVALQCLGKLVSNEIYLGISNNIRKYVWARRSI